MSASNRPALVIGAALDWELRAVLCAVGETERIRHGELSVWQGLRGGRRVLLYRTGVGVAAATRRTAALLAAGGVESLINTGCAGGLRDDLRAGALLVADEIVGPLPELARFRPDPALSQRLRRATASAGLYACGGAVLTSPVPLLSAASKRWHRDSHAASAVDMESAAVGAVAAARGVPVASLRAILDSVDADLPPTALLPPQAGVRRVAQALGQAVQDPGDALALARLGLAQRSARTAMEAVFRSFFQELDDPSLLV